MSTKITKSTNDFEYFWISFNYGLEIGKNWKSIIPQKSIKEIFNLIDKYPIQTVLVSVLGLAFTKDILKSSGIYIGILAGLK